MKFLEVFNNYKSDAKVKMLADIGSSSFSFGKTDKNELRTPTYEIEKCIDLFQTNTLVNSGIEQLMLFLFPNKELTFKSKDKKTEKFLNDWISLRPELYIETKLSCQTNFICGNGPIETYFTNDGVFDNAFSFNNASSIFKNPNDTDGSKAYVLKLDRSILQFNYRGQLRKCDLVQIYYTKGSTWFTTSIWGIYISDKELYVYKSGWSLDNLYGRSSLASAIDTGNVMNNIISSWDTISKTKQIDHKIITPETKDGDTVILDDDTTEKLAEQLDNSEGSYSILPLPFKLLQTNIQTSGNYDLMEGVFELLRRSLMMSLLPNHLTTWSDSTTTQGAETSMPSFLARLKTRQNQDIIFINDLIINNLRKTYTWLAKDATAILGEPKIRADEYYVDIVERLLNLELLSKQEAKDYLFSVGILNKDIFDEKVLPPENKIEKKDDKDKPLKPTLTEAIKSFEKKTPMIYNFKTFKKRLNKRFPKKFETKNWLELESKNIGGHNTRLIEGDSKYYIFDGLNIITELDKKVILKNNAIEIYNNVVNDIIKSFDIIEDSVSLEDKAVDKIEKEIKKLIKTKIMGLFKLMSKHQTKKENFEEAFLSPDILGAFKNLFKGFSSQLNDITSKVTKDLGIEIIDDDSVPIDNSQKKDLKSRQDLMLQSLKADVKKTSDDFLAGIKRQLTNGIASGKSLNNIKKDIEQSTNYRNDTGWKFDRVVRTTTRQINGVLRLQKYLSAGFETFKWKTRQDSKVRPSHKKKNNKIFNIKKALNSSDMDSIPGKNFGCRCIALPFD